MIEGQDTLQCGKLLRELKQDWDLAGAICGAVHNRPAAEFRERLRSLVSEKGLIRIWEEKPVLNGGEIGELTGVTGPMVGKVLEEVWKWQILNRTGTKEACIEYIRALHTASPPTD